MKAIELWVRPIGRQWQFCRHRPTGCYGMAGQQRIPPRIELPLWRDQQVQSTVMAGQRLGIRQVDEDIWLVSFMHYNLGYIDLAQRTLQTIDNPFGTRLSTMS